MNSCVSLSFSRRRLRCPFERLFALFTIGFYIFSCCSLRWAIAFSLTPRSSTRPTVDFFNAPVSCITKQSHCTRATNAVGRIGLISRPSSPNDNDDISFGGPASPGGGGGSKKSGGENSESETLLCMNLIPLPGVSMSDAYETVQQYSRTFPFCAILPVQPLTYNTVPGGIGSSGYDDRNSDTMSVQLKFLRKKTDLKPGIDGGINFYIERVEDEDEDENDHDKEENDSFNAYSSPNNMQIQVTAKRNTYGQSITKMMAEKIIVTRFVAGLKGESDVVQLLSQQLRNTLNDKVRIASLYHKWMDNEFPNP